MPVVRRLLAALTLVALLCCVPSGAAAATPVHDAFEQEVLLHINEARAAEGLVPLRATRRLARAASRHSRDQLLHDRLTHDGGNGTPFGVRMARIARGGSIVGETVAFLPDGMAEPAAQVVQMWLASPGHRAQLLRPRFRKVGIGRWHGGMGLRPGIVVTADFSSR